MNAYQADLPVVSAFQTAIRVDRPGLPIVSEDHAWTNEDSRPDCRSMVDEYGVLDFVGKPFTKERLQKAIMRFENIKQKNAFPTKYVAVKKFGKLLLIQVEEIRYIKGAGIYSEIVLKKGRMELHDKSLNRLESILPSHFIRVHKSYIVNIQCVESFTSMGGSKYHLKLTNDEILPVSRIKYKDIKNLLTR